MAKTKAMAKAMAKAKAKAMVSDLQVVTACDRHDGPTNNDSYYYSLLFHYTVLYCPVQYNTV